MPDHSSLIALHAAVAAFLATADGSGAAWSAPRAPGKWSPSQVVEHVALIMEESANVVAGARSKFPTIPRALRPVARLLVFKRILRRGAFLRMKAIEAFKPPVGAATPAAGRVRVERALARFDESSRARVAAGGKVASTIFGPVSVSDFVRFQELHVRHHHEQIRVNEPRRLTST
jgi:hypothetical protein